MRRIYCILLLLLFCAPVCAEELVDPVGIVENLIKVEQALTQNEKTILLQALDSIASDRFESSRRKIARQDSVAALEKFAREDSNIARTLSFILAKSAEEALFQAEIERTKWLVVESRKVYLEQLPARDQILEQLAEHPLLKSDSNFNIFELTSKESVKKKVKSPQKFKILLLVSGALWLISILSYLFAFKAPETKEKEKVKKEKQVKKEKKKQKVETKKTDLKKEDLLIFF